MTKPRIRIRADGWIRHDGGERPAIIPEAALTDIIMSGGLIIRRMRTYVWRDTPPYKGVEINSNVSFWRFSDVA